MQQNKYLSEQESEGINTFSQEQPLFISSDNFSNDFHERQAGNVSSPAYDQLRSENKVLKKESKRSQEELIIFKKRLKDLADEFKEEGFNDEIQAEKETCMKGWKSPLSSVAKDLYEFIDTE